MSTIIKIFKNLGTIVILLFQIVYESIVDYIKPHDNAKPKHNKFIGIRKIDLTKERVFVPHKPLYKRTRRQDKPKPKQSNTKNKTTQIDEASSNTPPSKLGQAWISQLKTIYDKNDK